MSPLHEVKTNHTYPNISPPIRKRNPIAKKGDRKETPINKHLTYNVKQLKPTPVVGTFYKTSMTSQSCSIRERRGGEGGAGADGPGECGDGEKQMGFRAAATGD